MREMSPKENSYLILTGFFLGDNDGTKFDKQVIYTAKL